MQQKQSVGTDAKSLTGAYLEVGSIKWYYELQGHGPTIVLIPSGEGDCGSFAQVAKALSAEFTVLTFDMPGFSRTSRLRDFARYSFGKAASEVAALVRSLQLAPATFYGCSSGGQIAFRLAAEHSALVRKIIVHEVAPAGTVASWPPHASSMPSPQMPEDEIIRTCKNLFRNAGNENPEAWDALGDDYHHRLERNYVTWVRHYLTVTDPRDTRMPSPDELRNWPITWTIGGLSPATSFFNNVAAAHAAGIEIRLLTCRHFPQVSIPDALATHIRQHAC